MKEQLEAIFADLMKRVEERPYDACMYRDGNFNYIHQQYVGDALVKIRELIKKEPEAKKEEPFCYNTKCGWHKGSCDNPIATQLNNCTARLKKDPKTCPCNTCPVNDCDGNLADQIACEAYRDWRWK